MAAALAALRRTFVTVAESLDLSHYAIKRLVNEASRRVRLLGLTRPQRVQDVP